MHQNLVIADLAEDQETSIPQRGDPGKWCFGQPLPVRRVRARLEPKLLRAAQHLGDADRGCAAPVANSARLGTNAVTAQQHHQRGEPRIVGLCRVGIGGFDCWINWALIGVGNAPGQVLAITPCQAAHALLSHVGEWPDQTAREIRQRIMPRHQHEAAVPNRFELGPRHRFYVWRSWVRHHGLVLGHLGDEQEAAVMERGDPGQRHSREAVPLRRTCARLKPKLLRAAQHFGDADHGRPAPLANLLGPRADAEMAQQYHQGKKPRINGLRLVGL